MAKKDYTISQTNGANTEIILNITITIDDNDIDKYTDYQWDSKLEIATAKRIDTNKRVVVPYTKTVSKPLQPKAFTTTNILSVEHDYLYY